MAGASAYISSNTSGSGRVPSAASIRSRTSASSGSQARISSRITDGRHRNMPLFQRQSPAATSSAARSGEGFSRKEAARRMPSGAPGSDSPTRM